MHLAVVIPAKDEEATIGALIDDVRDACSAYADAVDVFVVSGSHDGTDAAAAAHGATVIRDGGTGLGEAMERGLKAAAAADPDYIATIDADRQFRPEEIGRLLEARDEADLVLGSRFLEDGVAYDMSLSHRIGNRILTWMTNAVTGLSLTDAQTGFRLMTPAVAEELRMIGRHTYVQEAIIDAHQNGFSVTEVPVGFDPRTAGGSKVVSSISMYALRTLPVLVHRSGLTPYFLTGLSLLLAGVSAVSAGYGLWKPDYEGLAFSLLFAGAAVQTFFLSMYLDSALP